MDDDGFDDLDGDVDADTGDEGTGDIEAPDATEDGVDNSADETDDGLGPEDDSDEIPQPDDDDDDAAGPAVRLRLWSVSATVDCQNITALRTVLLVHDLLTCAHGLRRRYATYPGPFGR